MVISPDAKDRIARWTAEDVTRFFKDLDLGETGELMATQGLTGMDLMDLNHEDLISLGLRSIHLRKKVLRAVKILLTADNEVDV